jgi:hypothetical protein
LLQPAATVLPPPMAMGITCEGALLPSFLVLLPAGARPAVARRGHSLTGNGRRCRALI